VKVKPHLLFHRRASSNLLFGESPAGNSSRLAGVLYLPKKAPAVHLDCAIPEPMREILWRGVAWRLRWQPWRNS